MPAVHHDHSHDHTHDHTGPDPQHQDVHGTTHGTTHGTGKDATHKAGEAVVKRVGSDGSAGAVAHLPSVGQSGYLTTELTLQLDGKEVKAPKGTVAVVSHVAGQSVTVKLWSGLGGKEATLSAADAANFQVEPGLSHSEEPGKTDQPMDYTYQPYTSVLWDGGPKAADVAQGYLGDCFLLAAMGAVAAANPGAIRKLFSDATPNKSTYTITLYARGRSGKLEARPITVDTALPTRLQDVQKNAPIYALMGTSMADHKHPIWPALLEKAYAMLSGSYEEIGQGGYPGNAMETITGVESTSDEAVGDDKAVLAQFQQFQKAGKAVICGTLGSKHAATVSGFTGGAEGPYHLAPTSDQGENPEIVKGSLRVTSKGKQPSAARDDSDGKLVGPDVQTSRVAYDPSSIDVTYKSGKGPEKAEELQAEYDWRGLLDKENTVYAHHAYIFESVTADGKLQFKNPWGVYHPKPLTIADFKKSFGGNIDINEVPK